MSNLLWVDTPALLRDGYGLMSLATTALSNAMRSPAAPDRGPAFVLPPFPELAAGALPTVSVTRLVGKDSWTETNSDPSILVSGTGMIGSFFRSPLAGLVAFGAIGGATLPFVLSPDPFGMGFGAQASPVQPESEEEVIVEEEDPSDG